MSREFEILALGSVGGWLRLKKKRVNINEGDPCPNCETTLKGAFCHTCGQFAEDMHRSFFRLCFEFVEGFFHVDGRIWQTLPRLIGTPGRLTSDYLKGKRAPQIPPFRLFLVTLLLLFGVGHCVRGQSQANGSDPLGFLTDIQADASKIDQEKFDSAISVAKESLKKRVAPEQFAELEKDFARINLDSPSETSSSDKAGAATQWLSKRASAIKEDPKRFLLILEIWAYRVAVLALPLIAFLISILFIFQRKFYIYDHLIFSTHLLTFHLILLSAILGLTLLIGTAAWPFALLSPVHVWFHMRKVYGSSVFGTLVRMFFLGFGTMLGFTALALVWLLIGANAMIT